MGHGLTLAVFMGIYICLLVVFAIQSSRLERGFKERHPGIAEKEIPHAFDGVRHPEQLFFFFRRRARELLREDATLERVRRSVIVLVISLLVLPLVMFVALLIVVKMGGR